MPSYRSACSAWSKHAQLRRFRLLHALCLTPLFPVLLAAAPETPFTARDDTTRIDACRYGAWSRATWLESGVSLLAMTRLQELTMSTAASAQRDSPARSASDAYVVGVAGLLAREQDSTWSKQWAPQLRAIRLDGRRFTMPRGGLWYAYPRAAIDDVGTLHVVWGEPDERLPRSPAMLRGVLPEIRSVWHATFRAGSWSRAERIYRGQRLRWDDLGTTRLLLDDENRLHVAFSSEGPPTNQMIYLSVDSSPGGRWRSTVWDYPPGTYYLDLAVGPHGQAAMAFISGVARPVPRSNVLSLIRSSDGGKSWSPPAAVTTPAEEPAFEPHLFFDRNAELRLVWVQQDGGSFVGGRLLHAVLAGTDRGPMSALALPSDVMTSGMRAGIDSCGTVHVFTQAYPHDRAELWYTRLTSNGWSDWARPLDVAGAHASIVASRTQVHVVWTASSLPLGPGGAQRSGLLHATLPILGPPEAERRH